jgi:hypothetical protein
VQNHSGSTYASISFRTILNQVMERVGVDYYGGEPFFTNNWKSQAILTFYKPVEPEAPLFDVCTGVCDTPPQAEESALVHALANFEGVLGWRLQTLTMFHICKRVLLSNIMHAWIRLCTVPYYVNLY